MQPAGSARASAEDSAQASAKAWAAGWLQAAPRCASPNFNARPEGVEVGLVIVHSISLPPGEYGSDAVERLFTNRLDPSEHPYFDRLRGLEVSAHFFVRRDGTCVQFVSCDERAWHAGASSFAGRSGCNDISVGIELEGLEGECFEAPQYDALAALITSLKRRYPIKAVVGHEQVAPGRKFDPGPGFDWARLKALVPAGTADFPGGS